MTTEWLFKQLSGSETLIITYGRLYNEAISAQKELAKQEINCDILKLTKIFPLDGELGSKIKQYPRVVFFEESMGEGSISEKVGNILSELGYCGDYSRVTANGFVKQASVRSCLDKLGLTRCRMVDYIIRRSNNNGKA